MCSLEVTVENRGHPLHYEFERLTSSFSERRFAVLLNDMFSSDFQTWSGSIAASRFDSCLKNVSSLFHSVIYLFSRCLDAIFCIIVVARLSLFPRQWINKAVQSYLVWLFFFFLADRLRFLQQEQQKETRDARTCCSDVSSTHRYLSTNTQ